MSKLTIRIGTGSGAYTFAVPPDFRPSVETLRSDAGARIGERHTWPVRGLLVGATPENVSAQWDALVALLEGEGVSCYFLHGSTTLQTLSASAAEAGPDFSGVGVTASADCAWNSKLEFDFEISADFYDASGNVIDSSSGTTYRELEDGTLVQVTKGKLRTKSGASAKAEAELLEPTPPGGYRLVESTVTTDDGDVEASYSYTVASLFAALPIGVRIAERMESEEETGGERRVTYRATFTGEGAGRAAEEYLRTSEHPVVSRNITRTPDRAQVEVIYTTVEPVGGGSRISFAESVTITGPGREITEFPIEGKSPVLFRGADRASVIRQVGVAVHRGEVPPERRPLDHPGLVQLRPENTVEVDSFAYDASAGTFSRRWAYSYLTTDDQAARAIGQRISEIIQGES